MSWHVDGSVIDRYHDGTLDRAASASVEAHVTSCDLCRGFVTIDHDRLERSWLAVADRVEPSKPSLIERGLVAVGVPSHWARIVAVSPALRVSFLLAVVLVMAFSLLASHSNPDGANYRVFLVVAPLLPVAGVAFAYGRLVDPAHELTMVSPIDSLRLLLLRSTTVLAVSVGIGLVAWPLVPAPSTLGVSAWLIPSLMLTLVVLALSSRVEVWIAGALVAGGWTAAMFLAFTEDIDTFDSNAITGYVAVAAAASAVVILNRNRYDREGSHR